MVTIYRVNGKEFNTYEDAKAYEEELEQKEKERIEKEEQKQKRIKELANAANEYMRLVEAYEKDYGIIGAKYDNKEKYEEKAKEYTKIINDFLKFFYYRKDKLWQLDRHLANSKQLAD